MQTPRPKGPASTGEQLLFLTDDPLRQGIELMFFASPPTPPASLRSMPTAAPTTARCTSSTAVRASP